MEDHLAGLRLMEEEDNVVQLLGASSHRAPLYEFCFVGCFTIAGVIHFPAISYTLADLWHPLGGIHIIDLGEKCFLFHFFNQVNFDRVFNGAPWTFNIHLLVFIACTLLRTHY